MVTKITWENIYTSCKELSLQCKDIEISAIVALSRGGFVPARILSELLNIRKIYSYGISSYEEKNSQEILVYQDSLLDILTDTSLKEIIIIDEIADSGKTFQYISRRITDLFKTIHLTSTNSHITSVRFASLYVRETCKFKPSLYHKIIQTKDWLVFPWEKEFYE